MRKILLIGDSISLYYSPFLASYISGKAELYNKEGRREAFTDLDRPTGGNGGDSSMVLSYIKERISEGSLECDIFVFNCGLHDIKRPDDGECVISEELYRKNLLEIIGIMKERKINTFFITTTYLDDERHNSRKQLGFTRYNRDAHRYNEIAVSVMKKCGIDIINLADFTSSLPGEIFIDHVHFSEDVRKLQAAYIAGYLQNSIG